MIVDIHTHTYPMSDDSCIRPEELIQEAKRVGLDGICISDHDRFWDPDEIAALSKHHGFLVLPGCEVTTEEGHLLVYGLREYVFGMHRAAFVKKLVDDAGGVMVLAHPYRRAYTDDFHDSPYEYSWMLDRACRNAAMSMVDAIDVMNGRGSDEENEFSAQIAERMGIRGVGASDAHQSCDLGTFATEFSRPVRCLDDFIREVRAGRFSPVSLNGHSRLSRA